MQNETFSVLKRFRFRNEIIISFHIEKSPFHFILQNLKRISVQVYEPEL